MTTALRRATRSWPWPGESREDKAKRVARTYRALIQDITQGRIEDPAGALHRLDEHWAQLDVHWQIQPRADTLDPDEWMTAPDLAHAIDRTRKDIYNWCRLGHIKQRLGPDGVPEYSVASVIAYQQKLNQRRASHVTKRRTY